MYEEIKKVKHSITLHDYFDYVIPPKARNISDPKTKGKYIRQPPLGLKEYYRDKNNYVEIKNHLYNWCKYIGEDKQKICNLIEKKLQNSEKREETSSLFDFSKQNNITDVDFYYNLFRFCFTGENHFAHDDTEIENLREFNEIILKQYGISGRTGKSIILQLASMNSKNPYILFEAGEIEYMKRKYIEKGDNENYLQRAFEYYKAASELGYALADWSLGYLAQMSNEKAWHIKEFENMSSEQKIEMAVMYYSKAAEKECSKAYNSLGNIVKTNRLRPEIQEGLETSKYYYYQAAVRNNVFGMYNYARTLENELRDLVIKQKYLYKNKKHNMIELGSEMLNYFKRSAELGYREASYRCALYYGHLLDEKTAMDDIFHLLEIDKIQAIRYLQKAIGIDIDKPCYDAYIFLANYIIDEKELFDGTNEVQKVEEYIKIAESGITKRKKLTERQKRLIDRVRQNISGCQ